MIPADLISQPYRDVQDLVSYFTQALRSGTKQAALRWINLLTSKELDEIEIGKHPLLLHMLEEGELEIALALIERLPPVSLSKHLMVWPYESYLGYAVYKNYTDVALALIRRLTVLPQALYHQPCRELSPLHKAITTLNITVAKALIQELPTEGLSYRYGLNALGPTPFEFAVQHFRSKALSSHDFCRLLQAFLQSPAARDIPDANEQTPIDFARELCQTGSLNPEDHCMVLATLIQIRAQPIEVLCDLLHTFDERHIAYIIGPKKNDSNIPSLAEICAQSLHIPFIQQSLFQQN